MSTRATLSALNRGGRVSQRGDTTSAEELRCAIPLVEDLPLGKSCVSHGARRCDKARDIASQGSARHREGLHSGIKEYLAARRAARRGDRATRAGDRATRRKRPRS